MSRATFRASSTQQGLTENMQILTGQKGDRLDKALTLREAAALGMVNLRRNGSGQIVPELPPDKPTDPEWSGVQTPTAPVNVTADGAFHTIVLTWDAPSYKGHAFAEIWRSSKNNVSTAVRVGTTLANVYSDSVGKGFKAFYWVRFVNKNSMEGPYHSTGGLYAETSRDIQDIIDELDGQIKLSHFDAWLKQDYEGVKETAATLESGVGSMWAVKASAGEIKAGIGLVAKSDGTSQVFLSASQVFAYDPNNPNNSTAPLFAIDQGKVVIQEALIKKATIQIIHSEKITADYIKAGVSISAPLITGGQIDMGNAFMADGSAGFGKGGPYGAWGYGWHTIIYNDGGIYTDRLYCSSGTFTGTVNANAGTFNNVTINENCDVRGTIYANKIVGDVVAAKMSNKSQTYTITSSPKTRFLTATAQVNSSSYTSQYQSITATASLSLYVDGVLKDTGSVEGTIYGPGTAVARGTASVKATISANANHTYRLEWNGGDGAIPAILFAETSGSIY